MSKTDSAAQSFRVWLAQYADWQPAGWCDVPPQATALEPADNGYMSAAEARLFVEGFNEAISSNGNQIWAVAVPVVLRYEGDVRSGDKIVGHHFGPPPEPTDTND